MAWTDLDLRRQCAKQFARVALVTRRQRCNEVDEMIRIGLALVQPQMDHRQYVQAKLRLGSFRSVPTQNSVSNSGIRGDLGIQFRLDDLVPFYLFPLRTLHQVQLET